MVTSYACGKSGLIICIVFFKVIVSLRVTGYGCAGLGTSLACDVWPMFRMDTCGMTAIP